VRSVLNQTYPNIELIVVDDASTDDTAEKIDKFSDKINYIRHDDNKGAPRARNTGINHSSGEYIAFIDSDDEWHSNKIEKQVDIFDTCSSSVGAVYSGFYLRREQGLELGTVPAHRGDIFTEQLMRDRVSPTSAVMVRKKCLEHVGGFDPALPARQDYELWTRIAQQYEFEFVKEPLVIIHTDSGNRISQRIDQRIASKKHILSKYNKDIKRLDLHTRRQIFGTQYYTTGRFLQLQEEYARSLWYLKKSVRVHPTMYKSYIALVISTLQINTKSQWFLYIKNSTRKIMHLLI
jgi:glycosyltransferase involved in cell wall biosynthesis